MSYSQKIILFELEDIVGRENIIKNKVDLDTYTCDVCAISRFWVDRGEEPPKPNCVVFPQNSEQVSEIVKLANVYKIPIIPRGGGAGDTLGALPAYGGILIDMGKMDRIIELNENSLTVTSETGILQIDLEEYLNERGYTLNHFPASLYCSSLGGFLANRGSGTLSTKYGKIDSMVLSLEVVLPTGEIINTLPVPDHSTGPELNRLFMGSEGTLGIITKATLKMHYIPEERRFRGFLFPNLHAAIEAGRRLMVDRLQPCVIRIYDKVDTQVMVKDVLGFDWKNAVFAVIGFDGFREIVEAQEKKAIEICLRMSAKDLGRKLGNHWWEHRFDFYYPPYNLEATPYLHGVIDTVATFENTEKIFYEMKEAIESGFKDWEVSFFGHFSHWYDWGMILYPTFIVKNPPEKAEDVLRLFHRIHNVGVRIALKNHGVVNEHHGIGLKLGRFMKEQYGIGFKVLQSIKKSLDPNNIMNPGKMGFEER